MSAVSYRHASLSHVEFRESPVEHRYGFQQLFKKLDRRGTQQSSSSVKTPDRILAGGGGSGDHCPAVLSVVADNDGPRRKPDANHRGARASGRPALDAKGCGNRAAWIL